MRINRFARSLALKVLVMVAAVMLLPGMVSASLIDLQETGVNYPLAVNVTGSTGTASITNQFVYAGLYQLSIKDPSGLFTEPFRHFDAYCVDPQFAPNGSTQYNKVSIAQGTLLGAAAWVLDQGYNTTAAEAQAAVWKLTWGSFSLNSGFTTAQQIVSDGIYTAALAHQFTFNPVNYSLAFNCDKQDYIYCTNPVPLPPSALLLGSGLLGLVGLGWRRKKTA